MRNHDFSDFFPQTEDFPETSLFSFLSIHLFHKFSRKLLGRAIFSCFLPYLHSNKVKAHSNISSQVYRHQDVLLTLLLENPCYHPRLNAYMKVLSFYQSNRKIYSLSLLSIYPRVHQTSYVLDFLQSPSVPEVVGDAPHIGMVHHMFAGSNWCCPRR